jgi:hypothetical protein
MGKNTTKIAMGGGISDTFLQTTSKGAAFAAPLF